MALETTRSAPSTRGTCAWAGVAADDLEPVELETVDRFGRRAGPRVFWVRPRHRDAFLAHGARVRRWGRWLLPFLVVGVALMVAGAAFAGPIGLGFGLGLLGILFVALPFATPETVEMLGVRKSVAVVRGMGVAMAVAGVLLILAPIR